jgi:hypothetical protein
MMEESGLAPGGPEFMEAWQCVGCGRIEAPQPCVGVCQDRKVRLVDAAAYEDALARMREAMREAAALKDLVRRLALTRPLEGEWERSYKTFQEQARRATFDPSLVQSGAGGPIVAPLPIGPFATADRDTDHSGGSTPFLKMKQP